MKFWGVGVNKRQHKYAQLWRTKDVAADETLHTMGAYLCCGDYLMANAPAMWREILLEITQHIYSSSFECCGLLHLPADSPVLIQSGFAMLAIAKISAARNRHPEMIVSLSISPADEAVNEKNVAVVVQM